MTETTKWVPGPYRVVTPRGQAPFIAAVPPEGVDANGPGGTLRVAVPTSMPGVGIEVEMATMHLMAAAPELHDAVVEMKALVDALPPRLRPGHKVEARWIGVLAKARGQVR